MWASLVTGAKVFNGVSDALDEVVFCTYHPSNKIQEVAIIDVHRLPKNLLAMFAEPCKGLAAKFRATIERRKLQGIVHIEVRGVSLITLFVRGDLKPGIKGRSINLPRILP